MHINALPKKKKEQTLWIKLGRRSKHYWIFIFQRTAIYSLNFHELQTKNQRKKTRRRKMLETNWNSPHTLSSVNSFHCSLSIPANIFTILKSLLAYDLLEWKQWGILLKIQGFCWHLMWCWQSVKSRFSFYRSKLWGLTDSTACLYSFTI